MAGSVTWYRKDFRAPSAAASTTWLLHFDNVRYRASVWLNGKLLGKHAGAYLPWELRVRGLDRGGVNRLVVRVDNRTRATDLPPARLTVEGAPNGGWWNYGGILGDVYLRRVDAIDLETVQVLPVPRVRDLRGDGLLSRDRAQLLGQGGAGGGEEPVRDAPRSTSARARSQRAARGSSRRRCEWRGRTCGRRPTRSSTTSRCPRPVAAARLATGC